VRKPKQDSEVLTIMELMKMSKAERTRRGKAERKRKGPVAKQPDPDSPHPMLRKWRKPEKPIEIIE
jgi:hypothetical protein